MNLNDILENKETRKLLENSVGKTYHRYKLFRIIDKEDFYQDCCIYLIDRLKKFDSKKASLKTYLPMVVMTWGLLTIRDSRGQSENYDKLEIQNSALRLDKINENSKEDNDTIGSFIEDSNYNLEEIAINKVTIDNILNSKSLTKTQKKIVELMLQDKKIVEIAKILNCTQGNISSHFTNIKRIMLKELG